MRGKRATSSGQQGIDLRCVQFGHYNSRMFDSKAQNRDRIAPPSAEFLVEAAAAATRDGETLIRSPPTLLGVAEGSLYQWSGDSHVPSTGIPRDLDGNDQRGARTRW